MKKIYLASPFFNEKELQFVKKAEKILRSRGFKVFSPREQEVRTNYKGWDRDCFANDVIGIENSDIVVALYHGNYSDSGTAWECGKAYEMGKPVYIVHVNNDSVSNLMVHCGCTANLNWDTLNNFNFDGDAEQTYGLKVVYNNDTVKCIDICDEKFSYKGEMT